MSHNLLKHLKETVPLQHPIRYQQQALSSFTATPPLTGLNEPEKARALIAEADAIQQSICLHHQITDPIDLMALEVVAGAYTEFKDVSMLTAKEMSALHVESVLEIRRRSADHLMSALKGFRALSNKNPVVKITHAQQVNLANQQVNVKAGDEDLG